MYTGAVTIDLVPPVGPICIGQLATFACTVHDVVSYWVIRPHTLDIDVQFTVAAHSMADEILGFFVEVVNSSLEGNSFVLSTLSVTADEAQNGTQINCTSNDGGVESVVLHIAGKLCDFSTYVNLCNGELHKKMLYSQAIVKYMQFTI